MDISVRGTGTIGSSSGSPLILIDGMEGDINTVNPQDIENISVLKDAAASSIYGSLEFGSYLLLQRGGKLESAPSIIIIVSDSQPYRVTGIYGIVVLLPMNLSSRWKQLGLQSNYAETLYLIQEPDSTKNKLPIDWLQQSGSCKNIGATYRKLYYSMQFDLCPYLRQNFFFGLGLFSRLKRRAQASVVRFIGKDWVFRFTYNYAMRYFFEANGAYNGSEKFGPDYRFAFFPSLSLGWMISEENLMEKMIQC